MTLDKELLVKELNFKAVRSSGAGGQHVNKVSSKVEVYYDLLHSTVFEATEQQRLLEKLNSKLTKEGMLILSCDEHRSQHKNKELVIKRLYQLLEDSLKVPKKRKATRPSKAAIAKRLTSKKNMAQKKALRKKPPLD